MTHSSKPSVYRVHPPESEPAPAVFDSPHSGTTYPDDFGHDCHIDHLRGAEDMYVDELFSAAPRHGAVYLCAEFPRSYIDTNRTLHDIDHELLEDEWPHPSTPSEKTAIGKGLVWRNLLHGHPIYDRLLSVAELKARIDRYYRPYHSVLDSLVEQTIKRHGFVYHINCHSMPPVVYPVDRPEGVTAEDFVLGDRDGASCEPEFTAIVAEALRATGASVAINEPFKGVELVRRHGRPHEDRHSLQIEINRRLYLNDDYSRSDGFDDVKATMDSVIAVICRYAKDRASSD
ncbi:MAG: N-formylglutamate amidohydrolase [Pseudomonadota bacterium]